MQAVWPFLDDPVAVTLHLLNLEELTKLLNGCAPDVIVHHSFAILVTARYLHAKVQGLHMELQVVLRRSATWRWRSFGCGRRSPPTRSVDRP